MKWLNKLEFRFRRYGISNLMNYIVVGMAAVFVLNMLMPRIELSSRLYLNRDLVLQGQVWRLITFVFLPPSSSVIWIVFSLYFYWLIGSSLESQWGKGRFSLFYLTGIAGNILAAFITGGAVNTYLNLSLFLAFAITYPDYEVLLFFILPMKMKYMALLSAALYIWQFIAGDWSIKLCIALSLINVLLFFGGDFLAAVRREATYWKTRYNFRRNIRR